jgi:hypothetical protein
LSNRVIALLESKNEQMIESPNRPMTQSANCICLIPSN